MIPLVKSRCFETKNVTGQYHSSGPKLTLLGSRRISVEGPRGSTRVFSMDESHGDADSAGTKAKLGHLPERIASHVIT
jgi:hypothetical protein